MQTSKKRIVGLFINRFDNAFQPDICQALGKLTRDAGYDMLVFNSFGNEQSGNSYEAFEKILIDLAPIESMDGIVMGLDTYVVEHRQYVLDQIKLRARKDCPIVAIRSGAQGVCQVLVDERHAIKGVIEHVINEHSRQRIAFWGGTKEEKDAIKRLECFRRVMDKYHLPVPEAAIFHGNFWRTCVQPAADYFFVGEGAYKPDAIICANDYMAMALMNELINRGFQIPKDIIVTGYDNVPETAGFSPSLTTMEIDNEQMAKSAFELIQKGIQAPIEPTTTYIPAKLILRESCGCRANVGDSIAMIKKRAYDQIYHMTSTQIQQLYFNINVSGCDDIETINANIIGNLDNQPKYRDFALCLLSESGKTLDEMTYGCYVGSRYHVALAMRERERIDPTGENDGRFLCDRANPLPSIIQSEKPRAYYFCAIHDRTQFFGYTVISFDDGYTYAPDYQNWMVFIGSALSDLCNRKRLERALEQNRKMSVTDPLTGLLNRRGFELFSSKQCACTSAGKEHIVMLSFDLDGLKTINDQYGHAEGDFALQAIADAIRESLDPSGIASRCGGDEFVAMFIGDEGKGEEAMERFNKAVESINARVNKPYHISASVGIIQQKLDAEYSIESLMRECDHRMYEAKAKLRRRRSDDR